jgi:hypothetical protein
MAKPKATRGPKGHKRAPLPSARNPKLAREGGWAKVIEKYGEDGWRKMCSEAGKKSKRTGIPHGLRRPDAEKKRASGNRKAQKLVKLMVEKYGVEDQHAQEALTYAVEVVKSKVDGTRDKLAAARLILDFCKSKPSQKSEVTIKSAEDLLNELELSESGTVEAGAGE